MYLRNVVICYILFFFKHSACTRGESFHILLFSFYYSIYFKYITLPVLILLILQTVGKDI